MRVRSLLRSGFICGLALLAAAAFVHAQQKTMTGPGSWSGVIINSNCSVDEAFAEAAKCTEKNAPGAKLSLYDDTARLVLNLDPQDQAAGHLGESVTVEGALQGDTIHVTSIRMLTGIGLAVGQKAPAFSARDQFGSQQTLDTLKGPNGTVLLFFRSADW
jgi:hypothetical protein